MAAARRGLIPTTNRCHPMATAVFGRATRTASLPLLVCVNPTAQRDSRRYREIMLPALPCTPGVLKFVY
jgi:hypothetical protein